ncbi:hypothetical protein BJ878DRAFT_551732 [Calycina marina]|uniref:ATPase AAA-type core domain-containing protein n=1 Tax=Calycina marina TaxID=1763456 RepID=A0A9P8CEP9_9HELO|nr:hypothetical protein BJ878DRAFT_551732 [Calycina marina]
MVDAAQFRKINPNDGRPSLIKASNSRRRDSSTINLWFDDDGPPPSPRAIVKVEDVDVDMQDEVNLIICSPTILGYMEFAVDDITESSWNDSLWSRLAIEPKRKNLTLALVASHSQRTPDHSFDEIAIGKGRGLIILFYGPPGVGKTLTAKALSEHLRRPLYTVAIPLRDATSDLDDALRSRIHLALRYGPLGVETRRKIWNTFLQNAIKAGGKAAHSDENFDDLVKPDLNGRQYYGESKNSDVHQQLDGNEGGRREEGGDSGDGECRGGRSNPR